MNCHGHVYWGKTYISVGLAAAVQRAVRGVATTIMEVHNNHMRPFFFIKRCCYC